MSGDYTRFTFRPRNNYSSVAGQQGRVTLDADLNEAADIEDRHWRSETTDIVGRAVVPRTDLDPGDVPSGFRIQPSGASFTIGRGRAYVDGLQAENHGGTPMSFDPLLAETRGTVAVAYDAQPFLPFPPALPIGRIAIYLDVWQREITWIEDPDILEKAIGVDTTTRTQVVWQVRAQGPDDTVTCSTALDPLPAAAGRLTTAIVSGPLSSDPCVIAAAGGYRGTENRTYRVQIVKGGGVGPGGAEFAFAHDNASIVSRVTGISASGLTLQVERIGRDDALRFRRGDWVEITNDIRELQSVAGEMRQIVADPDEDRLEITLGGPPLPVGVPSALTPFVLSTTDPRATHTRVKRWNQRGLIEDAAGGTIVDLTPPTSGGTIPVPASSTTEILLGDGIKVSFSVDVVGGQFRVGDYWVFAARTIDGSVEILNAAPPRGIHHHFARLAVGTLPGWVDLSDCRTFWPPTNGGCCTFVVAPGDSIQKAIDDLPPEGGCICLKAGIHEIKTTIILDRSYVHLHGESEGAEIRGVGVDIALLIVAGRDVMVEDLAIVIASEGGSPGGLVVLARGVEGLILRNLEISVRSKVPNSYFGILVSDCADVVIDENVIANVLQGVHLEKVSTRCWVTGNRLIGQVVTEGAIKLLRGRGVHHGSSMAADHRIEQNVIENFIEGIVAEKESSAVTIASNRILRVAGNLTLGGPLPLSTDDLRNYLNTGRFYAIDVLGGHRSRVHDNYIDLLSDVYGGIRVRIDQVLVRANHIVAALPEGVLLASPGIYCGAAGPANGTGSTIIANNLQGQTTGIVVSLCNAVAVTDNRVDGEGRGWYAVRLDDCLYTTVTGTLVAFVAFPFLLTDGDHNVVSDNRMALSLIGIAIGGESNVTLDRNEITGATFGGIVAVIGNGDCSITDCRVVNCGWSSFASLQGGLVVGTANLVHNLRIESCEIIESGVAPDGTLAVGAVRGIHTIGFRYCQLISNRVIASRTTMKDDRAILSWGPQNVFAPGGGGPIPIPHDGPFALISNNVCRGRSGTILVDLDRQFTGTVGALLVGLWYDRVVFANNVCEGTQSSPTVKLGVRHAAVSANMVTSASGPPSSSISGINGFTRGSVVGNVTSGSILNFTPAPPVSPFNETI